MKLETNKKKEKKKKKSFAGKGPLGELPWAMRWASLQSDVEEKARHGTAEQSSDR